MKKTCFSSFSLYGMQSGLKTFLNNTGMGKQSITFFLSFGITLPERGESQARGNCVFAISYAWRTTAICH